MICRKMYALRLRSLWVFVLIAACVHILSAGKRIRDRELGWRKHQRQNNPWLFNGSEVQLACADNCSHAQPRAYPLGRQGDLLHQGSEKRSESILLFQTVSIKAQEELERELDKIREDALSLLGWREQLVHWRVYLVCAQCAPSPAKIANFSSLGVTLLVEHVAGRYNKFRFLKPHVEEFSRYDYLILKDADMRIAGFAWRKFMKKIRHSCTVIAGPIRATAQHAAQWFQIHEASLWRQKAPEALRRGLAAHVPFVEQSFVAFRGSFATWFFRGVLTDHFINRSCDHGPDLMWCV